MSTTIYDVAVVGGGPAGIAAAAETAAGGARVVLIDATASLGGQYFRPPSVDVVHTSGRRRRKLEALGRWIDMLATHGVDIAGQTRVWGVFQANPAGPPASLGEDSQSGPFDIHCDTGQSYRASTLIVAPGVYDRPVPIPGWTLPGVMTPGGAQTLIDKYGLVPGRRVIVGGTGPLQLAVAASLIEAGADVVAMVDACRATDGLTQAPRALWRQWGRIGEITGYVATVLRHRVAVQFGSGIFEILGTEATGVRGAVVGRVDSGGFRIPGTERVVEADLVCHATGFLPSVELTRQLGCAHHFDERISAHVPTVDAQMRTNIANVLVAGDVTGAAGQPMATLQGRLAAISALETLGLASPSDADRYRARLQPAVNREERFSRMLWQRWRPRPGFIAGLEDHTVLCRCEDVMVKAVREACADGARDLYGVKLRTRLGMGICQGLYCNASGAELVARLTDQRVSDIAMPSVRPPVVPVRFSSIVGERPERP